MGLGAFLDVDVSSRSSFTCQYAVSNKVEQNVSDRCSIVMVADPRHFFMYLA